MLNTLLSQETCRICSVFTLASFVNVQCIESSTVNQTCLYYFSVTEWLHTSKVFILYLFVLQFYQFGGNLNKF